VVDLANVLEGLDEPAPAGRSHSSARSSAKEDKRAADRDAKPANSRTAAASSAKDKESKSKGKKPAAPPKDPSRVWVQVAGGANEATLPRAYAAVKAKAPKLLNGRSAWSAANRATNRVLVGPFDSEDDAQDFVNKLAKADVSAFTFTSEKGQKIEKLPPK
jgi:hypothetical protein